MCQGSVQGIDDEISENILHWINRYASTSLLNVSQPDTTPLIVLKLGHTDRPLWIRNDFLWDVSIFF